MKRTKKILSVVLALMMLGCSLAVAFSASAAYVVSSVSINCDLDAIDFDISHTIGEVEEKVNSEWSIDTYAFSPQGTSIYYYDSVDRIWTDYHQKSTDKISSETEYAVSFGMNLKNGYEYPDSIKAIDRIYSTDHQISINRIDGFSVIFNGTERTDALIDYFDGSYINFLIPIGKGSATDAEGNAICRWCGKVHSDNFIQKITAWFHSLFAKIFGAKY